MGDIRQGQMDTVFARIKEHFNATIPNSAVTILEAIRAIHPDKRVTVVDLWDANLKEFAEGGNARATLRRGAGDDGFVSNRTYIPARSRMNDREGKFGEHVTFGVYDYVYLEYELIVYHVQWPTTCGGTEDMQYIVTPKRNASAAENCPIADELIKAAGDWGTQPHQEVWVFDSGFWDKDRLLWQSIQSASWDDVILAPATKQGIIDDVESFFSSRAVYDNLGVEWKRGVIFHGSPGCGKTITIKALMKTLQEEHNIATLYVKSLQTKAGPQRAVRKIFEKARLMAPCLLVFEDLDSLVVDKVRSYFLNEVDGLERNDGILMIGSTNHIERLDPGISKRPSRFDRKYHYTRPGERERTLYCQYWQKKLQGKMELDPDIIPIVVQLTEGFSFAYLKELFVQTLVSVAGARADINEEDEDLNLAEAAGKEQKCPEVDIPEHLQSSSLMTALHKQAKALWRDMGSEEEEDGVHTGSKTKTRHDDDSDDDSDSQDYRRQLELLEAQNAARMR